VVERLSKKGLAPQTIHSIALVFKLVVSSVCDEDGNQLYNTKWNARFIDMPAIDAAKQNTPAFTSEQVSKIVAAASGRFQMVAILLAATGLRIGELLGLECRHFDGTSVKVEQSIWNGRAYPPKTLNAFRTVDLVPEVCSLLKSFIGERTTGYIFQTCGRKPLSTVNLLTRDLHPLLDELGISRCGFHAYRRFRNTHLRQSRCPTSILKYWMGHADRDMSALYDKSAEDVTYRRDVCRSMGVGFSLPKTLADGPLKVVLSGVTGVSTETAEVAVHVDSIG
jgi:integrase